MHEEWRKPLDLDSDLVVLWQKLTVLAKKAFTPIRIGGWLLSKTARPTRQEIELIVFRDWLAEQRRLECPIVDLTSPTLVLRPGCELPPDHHIAGVAYMPLPAYDRLMSEFDGRISPAFERNGWKIEESCAGISTAPGDRLFWDADPLDSVGRDKDRLVEWAADQQTKIAPYGWRPATHTEGFDFLRTASKREFFSRWSIVLGSSTSSGNGTFYMAIIKDGLGSLSVVYWEDEHSDWSIPDCRILLIARRPGETYDGIAIDA
jgi:hypothetical protein